MERIFRRKNGLVLHNSEKCNKCRYGRKQKGGNAGGKERRGRTDIRNHEKVEHEWLVKKLERMMEEKTQGNKKIMEM